MLAAHFLDPLASQLGTAALNRGYSTPPTTRKLIVNCCSMGGKRLRGRSAPGLAVAVCFRAF